MPIVMEDNRKVAHTASVIATVLMTGVFAAVWLLYYNRIVFRTYLVLDAAGTILIWLILYLKFARIYRAFKIASSAIGEIGFSQLLSVGFADLILYVSGCLVARNYVNVLPGAIAAGVQILVGFLWASKAKQYFLHHVHPQNCLLLYDTDISDKTRVSGREFAAKLEKTYGHLFHIVESHPVTDAFHEACAVTAELPYRFCL